MTRQEGVSKDMLVLLLTPSEIPKQNATIILLIILIYDINTQSFCEQTAPVSAI